MIDLPNDGKLWTPPKPAIIRPATRDLLRYAILPGLPLAMGRGGGGDFALTHTDNRFSTADQTTYNFSNVELGDDGPARFTVLVAGYISLGVSGSAGFDQAMIATQETSIVSDGSKQALISNTLNAIVIVIADTSGQGSVGHISITWTAHGNGCGIAVFRLVNPSSEQAHAVVTNDVDINGDLDLSLAIPAGGAAVAGLESQNGGLNTWTGLSETIDEDISSNDYFSAAYGGSPGAPHPISVQSANTTPSAMFGASASWA